MTDPRASDALFRTILGMNDECLVAEVNCIRIPYFSNPGVQYNGFATSDATANEAAVPAASQYSVFFRGMCFTSSPRL